MSALSGRKVLITGGAIRVGAAMAAHLYRSGMQVVVHCRQSQEKAAELKKELPELQVVYADFSCRPTPERLQEFWRQTGRIDVLINNASAYLHADAETLMNVNFYWPQMLTQTLAEQPGEHVVLNMVDSSVMAENLANPYEQSKFLLRQYTLQAAKQFAPGMRVNAIALGPVMPPEELKHLQMRKTLSVIPLKRKVELADVTCAVQFLLENSSITGAVLDVDCGMRLLKCN